MSYRKRSEGNSIKYWGWGGVGGGGRRAQWTGGVAMFTLALNE